MSNHLISEVYKRKCGNIARKAIMVLMADKASDDGSGIWSSKQRMADEIGASKQTVIATIKSLMDDGLISERGQRRCPNGYTVEYAINVQALRSLPLVKSHADDQSENLTGQNIEPVKEINPTSQIPLPHQSENLTPPVKSFDPNPPKPPMNLSVAKATSKRARAKSDFILPDDIPSQPWIAFCEMRMSIRKPLTDHAKKLAVEKLRTLARDGYPPGEVLNQSTMNCWQGLFEIKELNHGNQHSGRTYRDTSDGGRPSGWLG